MHPLVFLGKWPSVFVSKHLRTIFYSFKIFISNILRMDASLEPLLFHNAISSECPMDLKCGKLFPPFTPLDSCDNCMDVEDLLRWKCMLL